MGIYDFVSLMDHVGHDVEVITYNNPENGRIVNVAIECNDCNTVLIDYDAPANGMSLQEIEKVAKDRVNLYTEETVFFMDTATAESLMGETLNNKEYHDLTPFTQEWAKEYPETVVLKSAEEIDEEERKIQLARIIEAGFPENNSDVAALLEEHVLSGLIPSGRYIIEKGYEA